VQPIVLNLSFYNLLDEGAISLSENLRLGVLQSLKSLGLIDCAINHDAFVALMSALEETETLETIDVKRNYFTDQGYLALASSLPNIKGLRQIDFTWSTSYPSIMPALLEGFRNNTSLHEVNIAWCDQRGNWSQELSFLLYRNKFSRLLQDSDTYDRESLGLWSRALGSVAARPDVLFHVLTSKAGLIGATPCEDSNKRKRDDSSAAADLVLKAGDVVDSSLCLTQSSRQALTHEIEMYGRESIPPPAVDIGKMPVLIIDNFNEATEKNKIFVKKLFNVASACKVFDFILATKKDWATTLVGLNGGAKIKPLHGNVNSAGYELAGDFTGVPDWNTLPWSVETLRELILPNCKKYGKDPTEVVPDGAIMTPVLAQDKLNDLLLAPRNS
jgi:hypothetical protein